MNWMMIMDLQLFRQLSTSDIIDSEKGSNGDLMQTFFGRDYPFLALFEKKTTFRSV